MSTAPKATARAGARLRLASVMTEPNTATTKRLRENRLFVFSRFPSPIERPHITALPARKIVPTASIIRFITAYSPTAPTALSSMNFPAIMPFAIEITEAIAGMSIWAGSSLKNCELIIPECLSVISVLFYNTSA